MRYELYKGSHETKVKKKKYQNCVLICLNHSKEGDKEIWGFLFLKRKTDS